MQNLNTIFILKDQAYHASGTDVTDQLQLDFSKNSVQQVQLSTGLIIDKVEFNQIAVTEDIFKETISQLICKMLQQRENVSLINFACGNSSCIDNASYVLFALTSELKLMDAHLNAFTASFSKLNESSTEEKTFTEGFGYEFLQFVMINIDKVRDQSVLLRYQFDISMKELHNGKLQLFLLYLPMRLMANNEFNTLVQFLKNVENGNLIFAQHNDTTLALHNQVNECKILSVVFQLNAALLHPDECLKHFQFAKLTQQAIKSLKTAQELGKLQPNSNNIMPTSALPQCTAYNLRPNEWASVIRLFYDIDKAFDQALVYINSTWKNTILDICSKLPLFLYAIENNRNYMIVGEKPKDDAWQKFKSFKNRLQTHRYAAPMLFYYEAKAFQLGSAAKKMKLEIFTITKHKFEQIIAAKFTDDVKLNMKTEE